MNLPKHVYAVKDRHGKTRYRFIKAGVGSRYVHGEPGTPMFDANYAACFDPDYKPRPRRKPPARFVNPKEFVGRSCVYFIGDVHGPVKIGTTVNLPNRLKKLQTGSPRRLRVLVCTEGDATLEAEYHARFQSSHVHGEWFEGWEVRKEINRLRSAKGFQPYVPRNTSNLARR